MTILAEIFDELGITQYLDGFIDQGFDTWETILDITEPDFDVLGVKLGHRRKLQRRIALSRGISSAQALASPKRGTPSLEDKQSDDTKVATPRSDGKDGNSSTQPSGKRKYRRHPKPDENAPERPPSAYVIFSNKMREDLKGRPLSFTEIAKLVGENWQNLSPSEKEPYEQQAFSAKEKYTAELSEYRKTESYRLYSEYLIEFKAKQLQLQESNQEGMVTSRADPKGPKLTVTALNENSKRPKLENQNTSSTSTATKSSTPSNLSREASQDPRTRVPSLGPLPGTWFPPEPALQGPPPPSTKAQSPDARMEGSYPPTRPPDPRIQSPGRTEAEPARDPERARGADVLCTGLPQPATHVAVVHQRLLPAVTDVRVDRLDAAIHGIVHGRRLAPSEHLLRTSCTPGPIT
ncbi:hypothetical protein V492_05571 [Pseudogymnoascus sp. VKM F-4246]|nr:hypothetical protein V492_05571 [Pseudogymnoascus sp. VKM F-4246]